MTLFKMCISCKPSGTQDSTILDDEPFRQFCPVTFQDTTHSKPDTIIPVHEVKQELTTMGEDACTEQHLFKVMIQEMITDSEFESLSRVSHPIPAAPSQQARVFRKAFLLRTLNVKNRHAELPCAGQPCSRPGTAKKKRGSPPTPFIDIMREQNTRTTLSGGCDGGDVRDADGACLMCLLDDQTTPKLRSLLKVFRSTASRKASVPFADTLLSGVEARMLSASRQSQSRLAVLRRLRQG